MNVAVNMAVQFSETQLSILLAINVPKSGIAGGRKDSDMTE